MIRCPHCGDKRSEVTSGVWDPKTEDHEYRRRRRQCHRCKKIYHTREYVEGSSGASPEDVRVALGLMSQAAIRLRGQTKTKPRKPHLKE